ncbi:aminomethyltransferase [Vibrio variabilis]|uniref:Aminomethyltransferase n=1 Tax=Vibrio variabilis TaxID=990271 RepID=A0ABQ0JFT9_9VIBR|nr:aminomethyltransferase [Vibrio variabilis]
MAQEQATQDLLKTPLHALHVSVGAKMVPFAGYDMPVQYPLGVKKEHLTVVMLRDCSMFRTWDKFVCTVQTPLKSSKHWFL